MRAGVLNVPEHMDALRPFHVEQCGARPGVAVLHFSDFTPLEPETAATALTAMGLDAGDFQEFQWVITRRTIHIFFKRPIMPDRHRLPLTVNQYSPPAGGRTVHKRYYIMEMESL